MDYYTGIDAVLLVGTKQPINSEFCISNNVSNCAKKKSASNIRLGNLTQQVYELNLHNIPDKVSYGIGKFYVFIHFISFSSDSKINSNLYYNLFVTELESWTNHFSIS